MTGFNFSQLDDDEPPAAPAPRADAYRPIDQVVEDADIDFEDDEDEGDSSPAPEKKTPPAARAAIPPAAPPAPRASFVAAADDALLDKFSTAYEQEHDPFLLAAAPPPEVDDPPDENVRAGDTRAGDVLVAENRIEDENTRIDVPAPDAEPLQESPVESAAEEPLAPRAAAETSPSLVKKVVGWFKHILTINAVTGNADTSNAVTSNAVANDAVENDAVANTADANAAVANAAVADDRAVKPAPPIGGRNFSAVPFPPLYQEDGDEPMPPRRDTLGDEADAPPFAAVPLDVAHLDDARLDAAPFAAAPLDDTHLDDARLDAAPFAAAPLDDTPLDDARLDAAPFDDNSDWLIPENELAADNDVFAALSHGVTARSAAIAGQTAIENTVDFAAVAGAAAPHYRDDLNDNLLAARRSVSPLAATDVLAETSRRTASRRADDDEWQTAKNRPQESDDEWQTVSNHPPESNADDEWQTVANRPPESNADDEWQTVANRPPESNADDEWKTVANPPRKTDADDEWKTIVNSSAIIADDAWTDQMPPAEMDAPPVAASVDFLNDEDADAPSREETPDDFSAPESFAEDRSAASLDAAPLDAARPDVARPDVARPDVGPEDDWMAAVSADENGNDWFNDDAPIVSEVLPAVTAEADSSADALADESTDDSVETSPLENKKEAAPEIFDELPPPAADDEWGGGDWLTSMPADAAPAPKPKAEEAPPPVVEESDFAAELPAPLTALIGFFSRVKDAVVKPFAAIRARLANAFADGRDALKQRREELEQLLGNAEIKEEKDENLPEAATAADWAMVSSFGGAGDDETDGEIEADGNDSAEPIDEDSETPVAAPPEVESAASDAVGEENEASASVPPAETDDNLTKIFGENAPATPVLVPATRWQRYYQTAQNQALRLWQITDRRMHWRKNWWLYVDATAAAVIIASTAVIFSYFLWG
ncbi:hypothetical protein FACS1894108_01050 [Planctomycetales bacterium]|nr:hypothetical protein FACS1894108_01050 [Planctomycetales bacterium]